MGGILGKSKDKQKTKPEPMRPWHTVVVKDDQNETYRKYMEDRHRICEGWAGDPHTGFFAVYDGHGGKHVVEHVVEDAHLHIEKKFQERPPCSNPETDPNQWMTEAYEIADDAIPKKMEDVKQEQLDGCGCTVATCILQPVEEEHDPMRQSCWCYTGNCGDTRVVLCEAENVHQENERKTKRKGKPERQVPLVYKAIRMTKDHKPGDEVERKRVEEAGGCVMFGRVMGRLAITRAFGDRSLKPYVSAEPTVMVKKLQPGRRHPFLILACDGIWDVMTDQEAVEIVLECMETNRQRQAAELLLTRAVERGTRDNLTSMVVWLGPLPANLVKGVDEKTTSIGSNAAIST